MAQEDRGSRQRKRVLGGEVVEICLERMTLGSASGDPQSIQGLSPF